MNSNKNQKTLLNKVEACRDESISFMDQFSSKIIEGAPNFDMFGVSKYISEEQNNCILLIDELSDKGKNSVHASTMLPALKTTKSRILAEKKFLEPFILVDPSKIDDLNVLSFISLFRKKEEKDWGTFREEVIKYNESQAKEKSIFGLEIALVLLALIPLFFILRKPKK